MSSDPFQLDSREIPRKLWDVLVLGAGPAGCVAAACLARRGWSVLLLDKASFPREKVCGDWLIADTVNCLRRLDTLDAVDRHAFRTDRSTVFSPGRHEVELRGEFRTLKRAILDELLARAAVRCGAAFAVGRALSLEKNGHGVLASIEGRSDALRARIALVGTGVNLSLLQPLGMVQQARPSAVALRAYVESAHPLDRMIVSYDRSIVPGYAWVFPMGRGEFNVGCGVFYRALERSDWNLRSMLERFVREFPPARELLARGRFSTPLRGAPLRCGLEGTLPRRGHPILAIGETVGSTFPFTGEGIGKAMETAELAAETADEALRSDDMSLLELYPARLQRLLPRYRGYRIAETWLSVPWLNDLVARRARRSPSLRRSLEGIANETVDPARIFSIGGLLRSFWG